MPIRNPLAYLNDLANVSVATPADDDLFYFDNATSLWKSRKLANGDIPAAIARKTFVTSSISTHAIKTTGTHGAGANTLLHSGSTDVIGGAQLTQVFGASATRLRNLIVTPIAGEILRILQSATGPFSAVINGAPTATSVVYDGEANENMFKGLASGAGYWGRIILHNTTRGNSRKVVSVNLTTNTITTESSTDDWADDDVITVQSQTNTTAGYIDVDISAEVPATTDAIFIFALSETTTGTGNIFFHPYEAYSAGKRQWLYAVAGDKKSFTFPLRIISQKFTMWIGPGITNVAIVMNLQASVEYADT